MNATPRTRCRICDHGELRAVFDIGAMPLANRLLTKKQLDAREPEPKYPLALNLCGNCGNVQLSHVVPPEVLYTDYPFLTGGSKVMAKHFSDLMNENVHSYVPHNGLVVEIGSNDGTALSSLRNRPVRVLGVDPALNIDQCDIPTLKDYFRPELARNIIRQNGEAHLIVACNVLAHVDDVHDFLTGVTTLLHPEGAFVLEVPEIHAMFSNAAYDQLYHEHLNYFCCESLLTALGMHDLCAVKIERFAVHGGSIRITAVRNASRHKPFIPPGVLVQRHTTGAMIDFLHGEFIYFARRANTSRRMVLDEIDAVIEKGGSVIGYGASAKGAIVLNYCGIGTGRIESVVDNTPTKIGKFMPGTHQAIINDAAEWPPDLDAVLLLAWNHRAEIAAKLRAAGFTGKVIVPHAGQF